MRRAALTFAMVALCGSGCTTSQARRAHRAGEVAAAGGLLAMLASGIVASAVPAHDTQILEVGLVFVPVSVVGALVYISTDGQVNERPVPHLTRRERRRAEAWELTQQAATAARSADCSQVQAIDPRVHDLDLEFHGQVFLGDVAIRRCLAP